MSHLYQIAVGLIALALVSMAPLVAVADEDDDYEKMLDLSTEAAEAVADGHYELGAIKFRQAYATYPDPILLNNEMIAWYRADDCQNALAPARKFLQSEGLEPEDRQDVQAVRVRCKLRLASQAVEEQDPFLAAYPLDNLEGLQLDEEEQQTYHALRQTLGDDLGIGDQKDVTTGAPTASSNTLWWSQIAGGIALTGIGMTMHGVALARQSALRSMTESQDAALLDERREEWASFQNTARWAVPTLYIAGGLTIGSGVFFLMRNRSEGQDPDLALSPVMDSEQLGLSLSGRF